MTMNDSTVDLSQNKYQNIGQTVHAYRILNYKRKWTLINWKSLVKI